MGRKYADADSNLRVSKANYSETRTKNTRRGGRPWFDALIGRLVLIRFRDGFYEGSVVFISRVIL